MSQKEIERLVDALKLGDGYDEERLAEEAADALAAIGGPAVPALLSVVEEKGGDWLGKTRAASILGEIRDLSAVPALLALVEDNDEDYLARMNAANALGKIGDVEIAGPLVGVVQKEIRKYNDVNDVTECIVRVIGELGEEAIPAVEEGLKSNSPTVRRLLVDVLAGMGEVAYPALGRALKSGTYDLEELVCNASVRMCLDRRKIKAAAAGPLHAGKALAKRGKVELPGPREGPVPQRQGAAHMKIKN